MTAHPDGASAVQAGHGAIVERCRAWRITLPPVGPADGRARRATSDLLAAWGIGHLEETATLLVSELVGNAVRHASVSGLPLELRLETAGTWLRIEVLDADPRPPQPRTPAELDESGFGFVLVEALADKWGVSLASTGKTVWVELDTSIDCISSSARMSAE